MRPPLFCSKARDFCMYSPGLKRFVAVTSLISILAVNTTYASMYIYDAKHQRGGNPVSLDTKMIVHKNSISTILNSKNSGMACCNNLFF